MHDVVSNLVESFEKGDSEVQAVWMTGDYASEELEEEQKIRQALPSNTSFMCFDDKYTFILR